MRTYSYTLFNRTINASSGVVVAFSSSAQQIDYTTGYAMQATYTGIKPEGTLSLLGSNDGINFITIKNSEVAITGAASGTTIWNVILPSYDFVKIKFQSTSATSGSLVGTFYSKGA